MDYLKDLKADRDEAASSLPRSGSLRRLAGGGNGNPASSGIVRDIIPPSVRPPRFQPGRAAGRRRRVSTPATAIPGLGTRPAGRPPAEAEDAAGIPVKRWEPDGFRRRRIRRAVILLGLGAFGALALLLPTFAFPSYAITLRPALHSIPVETAISADTERLNPDPGARRIPALLVGVSDAMSEEYEATGKKFVSEKAQGRVLIFNAYSSSPQTLVATTRLQSPSGAIYRLRDTVTVPGAEVEAGKIVPTSLAAVAVADEAGEAANSGPAEFRIPGFRGSPKYQGFYAKAEQGFSGGFVGEASIVTQEDLARASEDLTRRIIAKLRDELKAKSPPADDFLVPDGAREVAIVSIESPKAGERLHRFSVMVSARGRLIALRRSHLTETIAALAAPPPLSGLTLKFSLAQPELALRNARFGTGAGGGELTFTASGKLHYYAEPNIEGLRETLRASTPERAEAYLKSHAEIESFRVKRFPAWLWFIPARPGGFHITVEPPA